MKYIKLIIIALILLIVFTAIFQNQDIFNQDYKFQLDFKVFQTPAYYIKNYAILGIAFAFGVVLSIFLGIFGSTRKRSEIKSKNQRIKDLEREISNIQTTKAFDPAPTAGTSGDSETSSSFSTPGS
ncbi:MAG: LapA family protein [Thermodesulfobacteriota bacterium]